MERVIEGFNATSLTYGDHFTHGDIENWAGLQFPDLDGMSPVEQRKAGQKFALAKLSATDTLREYLLTERQMYLVSIPGSGYQIVQPAEQTEAAVRRGMATIEKGLKHAISGVDQVNRAMLTTEEREYNTSVSARLTGLKTMLGRKRDYLKLS